MTRKKRLTLVLASSLLVLSSHPGIASDTERRIEKPVRQAIKTRRASQQAEEKWRLEKEKLTDQFEQLQAEQKQLQQQQRELARARKGNAGSDNVIDLLDQADGAALADNAADLVSAEEAWVDPDAADAEMAQQAREKDARVAELSAQVDTIFLSLPNQEAVYDVICGAEGILDHADQAMFHELGGSSHDGL